MSALIIVEHDNQTVRENIRAVVTCARQVADSVTALVIGDNCRAVADATAAIAGIDKVKLVQHAALAHGISENCAPIIAAESAGMTHVLMAAGAQAREWLPRAAALADMQMITDVIAVNAPDTFVRPLYAGNALATVQSSDSIKFMSIRPTAFAPIEGAGSASVEEISGGADSGQTTFIEARTSSSDHPELTTAKIVVSGGRGVGSAENFQLLETLANKLSAAVGASRAAVDAGYVPNDYQVGQTGKIVAPDLYIAIGISGAIQHIAGMKDSKCIVAINKDPDAPIFEIADYGLVADLFEALPQLQAALE